MEKRRLVIELLGLHKDKAYGFQRYMLNILDYFYAHRDEILYDEIILLCKDAEVPLLSKYTDKFKLKGANVRNYVHRLWLQTYLPMKLRLSDGDLLLSPGNTSGLIKKCPEVLVIHDLLFKQKELCHSYVRRHRTVYIPWSIRKADRIVAISDSTKADVEYYYPHAKGKIEVIYNPIQFGKYDGGSENVDIDSDYFLAVSNNANYKNQKTILQSYRKYKEQGGERRLVMIGILSTKSEAYLEFVSLPQTIKDSIIWRSGISNEELGSWYCHAACFISASKFEGLGMPVIEAMSFGLPVVLSDIPVHHEVSQDQGVYFSPTDINGLASIMLNMDFHKCSYADMIRSRYSDDNTSARYVELINRMWS